jgi:diadenosine tetraphosphatase ApaH/serine/threonine PP2A family protein phosphatase
VYHHNSGRRYARLLAPNGDTEIALSPRAIINPGSVGQPRDRDARAAYLLFDIETAAVHYHRISYDIQAVQERMRSCGLPERHIARLAGGW